MLTSSQITSITVSRTCPDPQIISPLFTFNAYEMCHFYGSLKTPKRCAVNRVCSGQNNSLRSAFCLDYDCCSVHAGGEVSASGVSYSRRIASNPPPVRPSLGLRPPLQFSTSSFGGWKGGFPLPATPFNVRASFLSPRLLSSHWLCQCGGQSPPNPHALNRLGQTSLASLNRAFSSSF